MSGGTLAGGSLVVTNPLIWTRGTISASVWCNGGTVSGGGGPVLSGGQLINSGTLDMSGLTYRFWTQYGGAISNLAGARLILPPGPGIILNGYQPATIYNYGWMGMCPGAGTVLCQAPLVNAGTLEVGAGTLQLGADSTIGGICTVSDNATLAIHSGTVNFNCAVNWAGAFAMDGGTANLTSPTPMSFGSLSMSGGTANLNSAVSSVGVVAMTGGTVSFNGPGTVAVRSLTMSGGTGGRLPGDDRPADLDAGDDQRLGVVQRRHGQWWGRSGSVRGSTDQQRHLGHERVDLPVFNPMGGAISNLAGARLILPPGPGIILNGYQPATIYNYGWMGMCPGAGTVLCQAPVVNAGTLEVGAGTLDLTQPYIQNAGLTCLLEGRLQVDQGFALNGGTLAGTNTLLGSLTSSGVVNTGAAPGAPGLMTISGNYVQTASGTLQVDLGGVSPGSGFDCLAVGGTASLAGTLNANLINGFTPPAHTNYTFLTSGGPCSGVFSAVTCAAPLQSGSVSYGANSATLTEMTGALPPLCRGAGWEAAPSR